VSERRRDVAQLVAWLEQPEARACDPGRLAALRARLAEARVEDAAEGPRLVSGDQVLGVVRGYGSVSLYDATTPAPDRRLLLELDQAGHVTVAIRRAATGEFRGASVRHMAGGALEIHPGEADHPLWGLSDRIVTRAGDRDGAAVSLTLSASIDWDAPDRIPPLAEPSRLPPGAGTAILNLLATLARERGPTVLRYRGPYPTEQLFWALLESFRFAATGGDPLAEFTRDVEALAAAGASREVPIDWTPAPHERRFLASGAYVQLRDGVEKLFWEGRTYYRRDWQGLERREHRVVRPVATPDGLTYVASLAALGRPLEDHLVVDAEGTPLDRPVPPAPAERVAETPLPPLWRDALAPLLALESTPLLAPAIFAAWPAVPVTWGAVPRDLAAPRGSGVRLAARLAGAYRAERARRPPAKRRALAQQFVRDVLGLVGPTVRAAAAAWLAGEPAARQEQLLAEAARLDRRTLAGEANARLARLLDALVAGRALPE
jgi:hypothetical protein